MKRTCRDEFRQPIHLRINSYIFLLYPVSRASEKHCSTKALLFPRRKRSTNTPSFSWKNNKKNFREKKFEPSDNRDRKLTFDRFQVFPEWIDRDNDHYFQSYVSSSSPSPNSVLLLPPFARLPHLWSDAFNARVSFVTDTYFSYIHWKQGKSFNPDCQGGYCRDIPLYSDLRAHLYVCMHARV